MFDPTTTPESIPWPEIISGGGLGGFLFALWMFLKHLRETQDRSAASDKEKMATIENVSSKFSDTVRAVSHDVQAGIDKMNETTSILLSDSREREAKLHELFRNLAQRQP